jgi:hypothetical protein
MRGVTHGSMSSVQLCRRFPHATPATAWCEAGKEAQDVRSANGPASGEAKIGRANASELSFETRREEVRPKPLDDTAELGTCELG